MKSFKQFINEKYDPYEYKPIKVDTSEFKNYYKNDFPQFGHRHIEAIRGYKLNSENINYPLRSGTHTHLDYIPEDIKHLDETTNHTLKKDYIGYRVFGTGISRYEVKDANPGDIIHDKGFTSTTLNHGTIKRLSHNENKLDKHYAVIHIPKWTKGYYLDIPHFDNPHSNENELLLRRGTHFRILKQEKKKQYNPITKKKESFHVTHMEVSHQPNELDEIPKYRSMPSPP